MSDPQFSIVCASIRPWLVGELIDSIAKNNVPLELIVLGKPVPEEYLLKYQWIKSIVNEEGHAKRCAYGVYLSRGKYITFVADDCWYAPHALDSMCTFLEKKIKTRKALVNFKDMEEDGLTFVDKTYDNFLYEQDSLPLIITTVTTHLEYFKSLGGIDKRFLGCEWEKDFCLRAYNDGAFPYICYDAPIYSAHYRKHKHDEVTLKNTHNAGVNVMNDLWFDNGTLRKTRRDLEVYNYKEEDFKVCLQSV